MRILCFFCPVEKKPSSEAVAEYLEGRKKYEELRKQKRKKGSNREEQVMRLSIRHSSFQAADGGGGCVLLFCVNNG